MQEIRVECYDEESGLWEISDLTLDDLDMIARHLMVPSYEEDAKRYDDLVDTIDEILHEKDRRLDNDARK